MGYKGSQIKLSLMSFVGILLTLRLVINVQLAQSSISSKDGNEEATTNKHLLSQLNFFHQKLSLFLLSSKLDK